MDVAPDDEPQPEPAPEQGAVGSGWPVHAGGHAVPERQQRAGRPGRGAFAKAVAAPRALTDRLHAARRHVRDLRTPHILRGRPRPAPSRRTLRTDDRGQILILTGVLLVLGFVVIGSTVIQVRTLEEATSRQQRDSLLDDFNEMVIKFNNTVVDGTLLGETDRNQFAELSRAAELGLVDQAVRRGMYLSVQLHPNPSTSHFWRESRCAAYDHVDGGVVFSYDEAQRSETVVGAVYQIYATDGARSMATDYYVKIQECVPQTMLTYLEGALPDLGELAWVENAQDDDDARAVMSVNETLYPSGGASDVQNPVYVSSSAWGSKFETEFSDNVYAQQTRPEVNDLRISYSLGNTPDFAVLSNVRLNVEAKRDLGIIDDYLQLTVHLNGQTTGPYVVPVTTSEAIHPIVPLKPGGGDWTKEDFEAAEFSFQVKAGILPGDNGKFLVDHIEASMDWNLNYYDTQATVYFDAIPDFFHAQVLNVSYQIERGTSGEPFIIQAWDQSTDSWDDIVTLSTESPAWGYVDHTLDPTHIPDNHRPRFRIVDSSSLDADTSSGGDLDRVLFDYFRIRSVWSP